MSNILNLNLKPTCADSLSRVHSSTRTSSARTPCVIVAWRSILSEKSTVRPQLYVCEVAAKQEFSYSTATNAQMPNIRNTNPGMIPLKTGMNSGIETK